MDIDLSLLLEAVDTVDCLNEVSELEINSDEDGPVAVPLKVAALSADASGLMVSGWSSRSFMVLRLQVGANS